ncbi:hypothetical protein EJB05_29735, partial [Eragrostis curvula]
MLQGRDILKRGIIKRFGPRSSIDIWEDNCIPGIYSLKPPVRLDEAQVERVNELFIPGTRVWNEVLVKEFFIPMDAEEILKVKPTIHGAADFFAWAFEKNAELTRRHVAMESHCEACGDPSESLYNVVAECTYARRFWEAVKEANGVKLPVLHPVTWAKDILSGHFCSGDNANMLVCGAWSLWSGRNAREPRREAVEPKGGSQACCENA